MTRVFVVLLLFAGIAFADSKVRVTTNELVLGEQIFFEYGKADIKAASHAILDQVAATLTKQKKLTLVEIQVHTDARGNDEWNLELSQKRADAVRDYLVGKGIDTGRLRPKGYGETRPIDKGSNEKAWAKNRRTQFMILQTT